MKHKTVYILGAGFSIEAGAPSQEKLIQKIFDTYRTHPHKIGVDKMDEFKFFLADTMFIRGDLQETIPLEDIFTPIDRCIVDNISFRNLSVSQLKQKRELVFELIGKTLQHILQDANADYIHRFARHLVESAKERQEKKYDDFDPVSVISTNWDILLDNSIYDEIGKHSTYDAVVDYCCYISSYDKNDSTVKPGLEVLGRGGFNVKLIKIHGSLNWLQCPRCQRLYVKFNQKIGMDPYNGVNKPTCRHCNTNFGDCTSHNLFSNLVMPTFLKDFSNPQYKIIWQNSGIELSEAKKIVFIGYSLPQADFEMRQLLSRMVAKETEIEVVDFKDSRDNGVKFNALIANYKQFFGREISEFGGGASAYINANF